MSRKNKLTIIVLFTFSVFTIIYYLTPALKSGVDKVFITISTFLFTIFTGFFISRQGSRYSEIRKTVSVIDGNFSSIYRSFGHLGKDIQDKAGKIIKTYYQNILDNKAWDFNLKNKTTTLIDTHELLNMASSEDPSSPLASAVFSRIMTCLGNIQIERKNLVALSEERIPKFQWITIYSLSLVLFLALLIVIPSNNLLIESTLKGVFSTSVIIVIMLLGQLNRLELFEGTIGEHSAQDVIDIIDGKK
ncbi:MAG: DUF4239 domain-containing protein [Candidatus Yonathbacteria bacterium]|nr:DUF4239 domain-containing protein [Candidatus Yonathbacteria bacterium]